MPGQFLYSVDELAPIVEQLRARGVNTVLLFGQTVAKDASGHSAHARDNIVLQAIAMLKKLNPLLIVITDVCLCSYTNHGHCGPLKNIGAQSVMDNSKTLDIISQMALRHAEAGADIVAPSGMVDGMVGAIRATLDEHDLDHVAILSYAVKYASGFYGPFRETSDCSPKQGDRRGYQIQPKQFGIP